MASTICLLIAWRLEEVAYAGYILEIFNQVSVHLGKKLFSMKNWYDAFITKICDILNQNQDSLKWHEVALKFNLKIYFTTYYYLVNAIPKTWKADCKNPIPNVKHVNTLRTCSIYSSLLSANFVPHTAKK